MVAHALSNAFNFQQPARFQRMVLKSIQRVNKLEQGLKLGCRSKIAINFETFFAEKAKKGRGEVDALKSGTYRVV